MTGDECEPEERSAKTATHTPYEADSMTDDETEPISIKEPRPKVRKMTWSQIRQSAPDLYIISMAILIFGIFLVASVPFSALFGTKLPFVPDEFLALGTSIMVFSGIALIILGWRLIRRERDAWSFTLIFLFIALAGGIIQGTFQSTVTAGFIVFLMLYLIIRRNLFTNTARYSVGPRETIAVSTLVLVVVYGVLGSLYLSDHGEISPPIENYTDALFFTLDTITTLGSADYNMTTETSQWFKLGLMVMGITAFLGAVATVLGPYLERRIKGVVGVLQRIQETALKDHILVCGQSDETDLLIDFLQESGQQFVVVSREREYVETLGEEGVNVVYGDPASEESLLKAQIENAKTLVAIHHDDAENAFIIITAKEIRPDIFMIAMANLPENIPKLKKVGAQNVVAPSVVVTRHIGRRAIAGHPDDVLEC
jgi:voltage-gated potassium channel